MRRTCLVALALALCLTPASADDDERIFGAVPPLDRSYVGPSAKPYEHQNQRYNLFLPDSPPPPDGYAVFVNLELSGWIDSHSHPVVHPGADIVHAALRHGMAVVWATMTVSRGGQTGNPVDEPPGVGYGPAYRGNGVFVPPGAALPAGYTGGVHPYHDPSRPMPEKDIVMIVQHLKAEAARGALPIDPTKLVLHGRSAAAGAAWWVAAGPDRADVWTDPRGQERLPTDVAAAVLRASPTWWGVYSRKAPPLAFHFPRHEPRGFYDHAAVNLGVIHPSLLERASPLAYGTDDAASPGIVLRNLERPLYLAYGTEAEVKDRLDGPPYVAGTETDPHTAWSGAAWRRRFCNTRLALYDAGRTGLDGVADFTSPTFDAVVEDVMAWLGARMAGEPLTGWRLVPGARVGSAGAPLLAGCGPVDAGTLQLRDARAGSLARMTVAASGARMSTLIATDPDGRWEHPAAWPAGLPPGLDLEFRVHVADPVARDGSAVSNGLAADVP